MGEGAGRGWGLARHRDWDRDKLRVKDWGGAEVSGMSWVSERRGTTMA